MKEWALRLEASCPDGSKGDLKWVSRANKRTPWVHVIGRTGATFGHWVVAILQVLIQYSKRVTRRKERGSAPLAFLFSSYEAWWSRGPETPSPFPTDIPSLTGGENLSLSRIVYNMPVIFHNNFFKLAKSNSKFQGVCFTQFYKLLEIYRCDTVLEIKRLDFRQNRAANIIPRVYPVRSKTK